MASSVERSVITVPLVVVGLGVGLDPGDQDGADPVAAAGRPLGLEVQAVRLDLGAGGGVTNDVASPAWRVFAILRHHLSF